MSGILGYSAADFDGYFRGAWLRQPDKDDVMRVLGAQRTGIMMRTSDGEISVPHSSITWDLISCADLGYRNLGDNIVINAYKRPARNTRKGIASTTVSIAPAMCFSIAVPGSAKIVDAYQLNNDKGRDTAYALFFPYFPTFREALTRLLNPNDKAFALAISSTCVIALDPLNENQIVCIVDESKIGSMSINTNRWSWFTPCARDMAQRAGVSI